MEVSKTRRPPDIEQENRKRKHLVADLSLHELVVEDVLKRFGLCQRVRERADQYRRLGYPRLHVLFWPEGCGVNHKKIHRRYVEDGLQVAKRKPSASRSLRVSQ